MISLRIMTGKLFSHLKAHYFVYYFQREVFGTLSNEDEVDDPPEELDFDCLKAQQAAKRAQLALGS